MIISAYPHPTHILDVTKEQLEFITANFPRLFHKDNTSERDEFINRGIKEGKFKLVVPNKGDIYFLGLEVMHRTNPEYINSKYHMVVRIRPHAIKEGK